MSAFIFLSLSLSLSLCLPHEGRHIRQAYRQGIADTQGRQPYKAGTHKAGVAREKDQVACQQSHVESVHPGVLSSHILKQSALS